ncbi:MAG: hypothetical protein WCP21_02330, partial [Armatimonadota bacterium]
MRNTVGFAFVALLTLTAATAQTKVIVEQRESMSPEMIVLPVEVPAFSIEHQVRLVLEARIDWFRLSGSNPWISVSVNGNRLGVEDLLNKTNSFTLRDGTDLTWFSGGSWRLLYSPDFELAVADKLTPYGTAEKDEPYRFVWDITRHVKPGANEIRLDHPKILPEPDKLVLRNVCIEVGKFLQPPGGEAVQPAPTGPLPTIVSGVPKPAPLAVSAHDGSLVLRLADQTVRVRTRLSLPGGGWRDATATGALQWTAGPCRVARK